MRCLFIIIFLLFSTSLWADSTFLTGLDFAKVYQEKGDSEYHSVSENGISVENFMNKITDDKISLGEKVALLSSLSSYYEWQEKPKGSFALYEKQYHSYVKTKYGPNISPNNESIKPEIRLLLQLIADYNSSSPNVKVYQILAKKMSHSLTAQTVSLMAFAYDILYNDKNDFATVSDLKNNYLLPYYKNLNNFDQDVPVEVRTLCLDELLPYTFDCEGRLKCLVDTSTDQSSEKGLNELSAMIKKNIGSGIKISDSYSSDWRDTRTAAVEWIDIQDQYIEKIDASNIQKAEIKYFFNRKLYELMHNIDYVTVRFFESSLLVEMSKSKADCKKDAVCAADNYLKRAESNLKKNGITQKDMRSLHLAKDKYKMAFENKSQDVGGFATAAGGEEPKYIFESNFDTLHYLILYFYSNPGEITQMYDLN